MTARRASIMLVVVTALWGVSFSWSSNWLRASEEDGISDLLSSLTLIGLRMPLAMLMLLAWRPKLATEPKWREHAAGVFLGSVFCVGFILQTWGLGTTTPALSGFFTALCNAWAPLIALVCFRDKVAPLTLLGLSLAFVGCAVLVNGWDFAFGDWLTVGASVMFAFQMLILDRFGKAMDPTRLTVGFFTATGMLAIICAVLVAAQRPGVSEWLVWVGSMLSRREMLLTLLAQALFPTALAFHWMNEYQPKVSVSTAALIYLLEPVFAAAISLCFGHDKLTYRIVAGGALIVCGNLVAMLPAWRRSTQGVPA